MNKYVYYHYETTRIRASVNNKNKQSIAFRMIVSHVKRRDQILVFRHIYNSCNNLSSPSPSQPVIWRASLASFAIVLNVNLRLWKRSIYINDVILTFAFIKRLVVPSKKRKNMTLYERPTRKAKRTDVDYAVLSSGQQIPEYSTEEDDLDDENYGSQKKKRRKQLVECFICHRPSRTYKNTMLKCDSCSRL